MSDNHDQVTTLFHHAIDHPTVTVQQTYSLINPQSAPGRWTLIRWGPAGSAANYAMPSLGIAGPPFTTFKRPRPVPGRYANLMGLNSFCHKESE